MGNVQAQSLQHLVEHALDPIVVCDADTTVIYANHQAGDLVGRRLSEITWDSDTVCHTVSKTPDGLQICVLKPAQPHRSSVLRAGQIAALGELAVGVSHEVKNPLMMMTGLLELALQGLKDGTLDQVEKDVQASLDASARITEVLNRLLAFSQGPVAQKQPVRLVDVVGQAHALLRERLDHAGITWQVDCPETLCVWGVPDSLGQVFLQLALNAREAIGHHEGWIRIEHVPSDTSAVLTLLVRDSGPGVPEGLQQRIFEPYFSTKPEGVGTGLGLSVSREVIRAHGGRLDYVQTDARGAFRLVLPLHDDPVTHHDR